MIFSFGESPETIAGTAGSYRLENDTSRDTHRIVTARFKRNDSRVEPEGMCPAYDMGNVRPSCSIVKPAIDNTRVDMSPYDKIVFADATDAIQAVDPCFDAMISEIGSGKMRVFPSDVMFDVEKMARVGGSRFPSTRRTVPRFAR